MGKRDLTTQDNELSPRELAFVNEWLKDENAERAWLAAGYECSELSARVNASKKLSEPHIRAYLDEIRQEIALSFEIDRDAIMRETNRIALFDVRKLFKADGTFKEIKDLDDDTAAAIAGFDFEQIKVGRGDDQQIIGNTAKLKFVNKVSALDMAHKILGSYKLDNEQKNETTQALTDFVQGLQTRNKGIPLRKKRIR
jgi:phage terminase small subunit